MIGREFELPLSQKNASHYRYLEKYVMKNKMERI